MQLLILLAEVPKLRLVTAIFTSVISGAATVAALICVLQSIRSTELLWWQFGCFAALAVVSRVYTRLITEKSDGCRHSAPATADGPINPACAVGGIRANRCGEVTGGFHERSLQHRRGSVRNFVHLFSGAAFLLACLAFLAWVSFERAAVVTVLVLITIAIAILLRQLERQHGREARDSARSNCLCLSRWCSMA